MSGKTLLTVPKQRKQSEHVALVAPWYRGNEAKKSATRPQILTFVETDFMAEYFAAVEASPTGWNSSAWTPLRPWRDYGEPPGSLFAADGSPRFAADEVERETPLAGELDGELPDLADQEPVWLRKLYRAAHCHFHLVTADVVCERFGRPPVDPARIIESGLVVRRLRRNPNDEGWLDWVVSPKGGGVWTLLADDKMHPLYGTQAGDEQAVLDPKALPLDVFNSAEEAALRARLALSVGQVATLGSQPLSPLPQKLTDGGKHTSLFGYLTVDSLDRERPEALANVVDLGQLLADRARVSLTNSLVTPIVALRSTVQTAFNGLRDELLPTQPSASDTATARTNLLNSLNATAGHEEQILVDYRAYTIRSIWDLHSTSLSNVTSWWTQVVTAADTAVRAQHDPSEFIGPTIAYAQVLCLDAMYDLLQMSNGTFAAPSGSQPSVASLHRALLMGLLKRVRAYRIDLVDKSGNNNDIYDSVILDSEARATANDEIDRSTVSSLSGEIDNWIAAEENRPLQPRPWDPIWPIVAGIPQVPEPHYSVHSKAVALELLLADIDHEGASAGAAYADVIAQRTSDIKNGDLKDFEDYVPSTFDFFPSSVLPTNYDPVLLEEQPVRGLIVHPGLLVSASDINDLIDDVANVYTSDDEAAETQDAANSKVIQPRFDAESIYAVWCWARVAGKDACETDQIVWSRRSEVFHVADAHDILGLKPVPMELPNLPKLLRDLPRIPKAGALPFAGVNLPPDSGYKTGKDPEDTAREWGIAWICSIGIPIFTICAWILFSIIFSILIALPGFIWMLLLKICIPIPVKK